MLWKIDFIKKINLIAVKDDVFQKKVAIFKYSLSHDKHSTEIWSETWIKNMN